MLLPKNCPLCNAEIQCINLMPSSISLQYCHNCPLYNSITTNDSVQTNIITYQKQIYSNEEFERMVKLKGFL